MMLHCRSMSFLGKNGIKISASAPPDIRFAEFCKEAGLHIPAQDSRCS